MGVCTFSRIQFSDCINFSYYDCEGKKLCKQIQRCFYAFPLFRETVVLNIGNSCINETIFILCVASNATISPLMTVLHRGEGKIL